MGALSEDAEFVVMRTLAFELLHVCRSLHMFTNLIMEMLAVPYATVWQVLTVTKYVVDPRSFTPQTFK